MASAPPPHDCGGKGGGEDGRNGRRVERVREGERRRGETEGSGEGEGEDGRQRGVERGQAKRGDRGKWGGGRVERGIMTKRGDRGELRGKGIVGRINGLEEETNGREGNGGRSEKEGAVGRS